MGRLLCQLPSTVTIAISACAVVFALLIVSMPVSARSCNEIAAACLKVAIWRTRMRMRQLAVLTFVIALLGIGADASAQEKDKGITYLNISASKCRSVCMQRGWSADNCKTYCRPGCRQAKTGGEHFCVVGKR